MKLWTIPIILTAIVGIVSGSPVPEPIEGLVELDVTPAANEPAVVTRQLHSGSLSAWTSAGSGCSGNPGFTWNAIGNGCIQYVGGGGTNQMVSRLRWVGQNCFIHAYSATGCPDGSVFDLGTTGRGTDICWIGLTALSFKVIC